MERTVGFKVRSRRASSYSPVETPRGLISPYLLNRPVGHYKAILYKKNAVGRPEFISLFPDGGGDYFVQKGALREPMAFAACGRRLVGVRRERVYFQNVYFAVIADNHIVLETPAAPTISWTATAIC
jgi:hypothetical protein